MFPSYDRWRGRVCVLASLGAILLAAWPAWSQVADSADPTALLAQARAEISAGDYSSAVDLLEHAVRLFEVQEDLTGFEQAASELIVCHLQLGAVDQAELIADQGRRTLVAGADLRGAAHLVTSFGLALRSWGEYEQSAVQLGYALALYQDLDDQAGQAKTHLALGVVTDLLGDLPQAIEHFRAARELYHSLGEYSEEAQCYSNEGYANYRLGDLDNSLYAFNQASYLYQRLGLKLELARTFTLTAMVYRGLDQLDDAARAYETAALLFLDQDAQEEAAGAYYELGLTLGYASQSEQALGFLDQAWAIWEGLGQTQPLEQMLADLKVVLRNLQRGKELTQYEDRLRALQQRN